MKGTIISINISKDKGEKKTAVDRCTLLKDMGVENDAHAGPGIRQVSLLATESIEKIRNKGLEISFGDFAENLTTEGIDLVSLPIGTCLKVGETTRIRITKIGKECHARCNIFLQIGDCVMPREGIFTVVGEEGVIRPGDSLEVVE